MGHYISFLTPKFNGDWYKFDDNEVTPCTKEQAINENWGNGTNQFNAYMLFYVRENMNDQIHKQTDEPPAKKAKPDEVINP